MGRSVRQKRKARSSRPVVKQSNNRRRPVNPTGNALIAANWDREQTLTQNYRRLGLLNRLKVPTGGIERLGTDAAKERAADERIEHYADHFNASATAILNGTKKKTTTTATSTVREVRVERDARGRIVRVLADAAPAHNPLNDLLNDVEDEEAAEAAEAAAEAAATPYEEWEGIAEEEGPSKNSTQKTAATPVVAALEQMARRPVGPKTVRRQSAGERAWLQTLVNHYGDAEPGAATLAAMAMDRRRNPFQRTANDLRRRLATFRAEGGAVGVAV